ncbi:hypothetical protein EDB80DRAFT_606472 [Ilyonectria destructans]|nr:hypothetical protein EDB80DRAFT_606472 [Ilyonectria destructans]
MADGKAELSAKPVAGRKRRAHKKVKTGCATCKIRKVRCDEEKPACNRCVSTGRKCDGYAVPSEPPKGVTTSLHLYHPAADSKLVLPAKNFNEIRSYQFFMDVTAPTIATTFDADFWRFEVPRICQSDPAIWHAIVSFGSIHESYVTPGPSQYVKNLFAMQQFSASIRYLTAPGYTDKWRALVISTIFTCVCHLEGLPDQARMHLRAGHKLLEEIQLEERSRHVKGLGPHLPGSPSSMAPVSLSSISSILTSFKITEQALSRGGISDLPTLILHHDGFTAWRFYTAPSKSPYLTAENLTRANRAAESLLNGLSFFMQKHAEEIKDLLLGRGNARSLESIASEQGLETRCFREISKTIRSLEAERTTVEAWNDVTEYQLKKALLTLNLYHETNRFIILKDPDEPDMVKRIAALPAIGVRIVDLAEEILDLQKTGNDRSFVPSPPTSNPLFVVAHSGFTRESRRRAVQLLKRPQMVGLWDTLFSARLAEAIMEREEIAAYQDQLRKVSEGTLTPESMEISGDGPMQPLHRIFSMTVSLTGRRRATISLRTWQDWIQGELGQQSVIKW